VSEVDGARGRRRRRCRPRCIAAAPRTYLGCLGLLNQPADRLVSAPTTAHDGHARPHRVGELDDRGFVAVQRPREDADQRDPRIDQSRGRDGAARRAALVYARSLAIDRWRWVGCATNRSGRRRRRRLIERCEVQCRRSRRWSRQHRRASTQEAGSSTLAPAPRGASASSTLQSGT